MKFKYVIVGAGLAGLTMAERIACNRSRDLIIKGYIEKTREKRRKIRWINYIL